MPPHDIIPFAYIYFLLIHYILVVHTHTQAIQHFNLMAHNNNRINKPNKNIYDAYRASGIEAHIRIIFVCMNRAHTHVYNFKYIQNKANHICIYTTWMI